MLLKELAAANHRRLLDFCGQLQVLSLLFAIIRCLFAQAYSAYAFQASSQRQACLGRCCRWLWAPLRSAVPWHAYLDWARIG